MSTATTGIKLYRQKIAELEKTQKNAETVLKRLVSDAKSRVPGWIATEVTKVYGIKKQEVTPAKADNSKKKAGTIKVKGDTIDTLQIVYRGRMLTPTHFGMSPKTPRESYTLKAEILKGQKTTLGKVKKLTKKQRQNIGRNFRKQGTKSSPHSPIMLMRTGSTYIPFQRKSQDRKDIEAIKTISLPQMVSSERTSEGIREAINAGLEKRMEQHVKLLQK